MEEHHARGNHREWKAALETVQRHSEFFSLQAFCCVSSSKMLKKTPQISKNGSITSNIMCKVKFAICPDIIGNLANLAKNWFIQAKCLIDIYIPCIRDSKRSFYRKKSRITMESNKQRQQTCRNDFYYFITDQQIKETVFQMTRAPW